MHKAFADASASSFLLRSALSVQLWQNLAQHPGKCKYNIDFGILFAMRPVCICFVLM